MNPNVEHYLQLYYQLYSLPPRSPEAQQLRDEMGELWDVVLTEDELFQIERQLDFEDEELR